MNCNIRPISVLILSAAMLAACTGSLREVAGEPPQASIAGLEKRPHGIAIELALRNVNDDPLRLDTASITMTLDRQALAAGEQKVPLTISSRGREVVRFLLPAEPVGLERLDALAGGEVQRLPWTLDVRLKLARGSDRRTETDGWLYRVPGQPNHFR